jgi:hypothetical protein
MIQLFARLLPTWRCFTFLLLTVGGLGQRIQDECDRNCLLERIEKLEQGFALMKGFVVSLG